MAELGVIGVMSLVGGAVSAIGAIRQGQAAQNQAQFQAEVQEQQAARARDTAAVRSRDFARKASAAQASRRAAGGASGTQFGTGSSADVLEDFETEKELNIQRLLNQGEVSSTRLLQSAELARFGGRRSKEAGFLKAGSSLIRGAGEAFGS